LKYAKDRKIRYDRDVQERRGSRCVSSCSGNFVSGAVEELTANTKTLRQVDRYMRRHQEFRVYEDIPLQDWSLSGLLCNHFIICRRKDGQVIIFCTVCNAKLPAGHSSSYHECFSIALHHLREQHTSLARELESLGK
jgi:hypothetical protein